MEQLTERAKAELQVRPSVDAGTFARYLVASFTGVRLALRSITDRADVMQRYRNKCGKLCCRGSCMTISTVTPMLSPDWFPLKAPTRRGVLPRHHRDSLARPARAAAPGGWCLACHRRDFQRVQSHKPDDRLVLGRVVIYSCMGSVGDSARRAAVSARIFWGAPAQDPPRPGLSAMAIQARRGGGAVRDANPRQNSAAYRWYPQLRGTA